MERITRLAVGSVIAVGVLGAGVACSRIPLQSSDVAARATDLQAAYASGVADARRDIAAGTVVILRPGAFTSPEHEVRIDRTWGLPLRDPSAICGTGVDTGALGAIHSGYAAEVDRALAAGELAHLSLAAKIVDESELRARFASQKGTEIGVGSGSVDTPDGSAQIVWGPWPGQPGKAAIGLRAHDGSAPRSLPFNRVPQRILWDHDGTTLHALGPDGNLATVDIPTGTWISVYEPDR